MSCVANDKFIDSIRESGNYEKAVEFGFLTKEEAKILEQDEAMREAGIWHSINLLEKEGYIVKKPDEGIRFVEGKGLV